MQKGDRDGADNFQFEIDAKNKNLTISAPPGESHTQFNRKTLVSVLNILSTLLCKPFHQPIRFALPCQSPHYTIWC